jgi:hypothetical protein
MGSFRCLPFPRIVTEGIEKCDDPLVLAVGVLIAFSGLGTFRLASESVAAKEPSRRKDNAVEVTSEKDRATFIVKSPSGIGKSAIERPGGEWPKAVVLRLHLKGLESFRASNGKLTLEAAVAFRDGKPQVRIWKDGKENEPLDSKSPFWLEIRMIGGDGKPAKSIPLKDGYFEMELPKAFFEGNPKSITVNWIDFYRN